MITISTTNHQVAVIAQGSTVEMLWELAVATAQLHLKSLKDDAKTEKDIRESMTKWGEMCGDLMVKMISEEGRAHTIDLSSDVTEGKKTN